MARKFILHFAELYILVVLSVNKIILFGNYFLKCYIVKRVLISFNRFSEYRFVLI